MGGGGGAAAVANVDSVAAADKGAVAVGKYSRSQSPYTARQQSDGTAQQAGAHNVVVDSVMAAY